MQTNQINRHQIARKLSISENQDLPK